MIESVKGFTMLTRLSSEQIKEITEMYKNGISIDSLMKMFNVGERRLKRLIVEQGVQLRSAREAIELSSISTQLTPQQEEEIVQLYLAGVSGKKICTEYKIRPSRLKVILQKSKTIPRSLKQATRRLAINEAAFDEITEQSAYWIGFLMADGSVVHRGNYSPQISVTLKSSDINHLYKLRDFLGSDHKISRHPKNGSFSKQDIVQFQFSSDRIAKRLAEFGLTPRKSQTCKVIQLESNRHFWRGLIDGDGSISTPQCWVARNCPCLLTLCASEENIYQFKNFLHDNDIKTNAKPYQQHNIWHLQVSHSPAYWAIKLLYEGVTIALDRKLQESVRIINDLTPIH